MTTTEILFDKLTLTLQQFINEINLHDESIMATDLWTVREVLAHVTFWHSNYADNYEALSNKQKPPLIDCPLYFTNLSGVDSLRNLSKEELILQLNKAHESLKESILVKKIKKMRYKENGTVYSSKKFLHVINSHIAGHIKQIKKLPRKI